MINNPVSAKYGSSILWQRMVYIFSNLCFLRKIAKSGIFCYEFYDRQYLKKSLFRGYPLLHYLIIGELSGKKPNPFFDPKYFSANSGGLHLRDYINDPKVSKIATSKNFDPEYYMRNHENSSRCSMPLLVQYWNEGIYQGQAPSAAVDIELIMKSYFPRAEDPKPCLTEFFWEEPQRDTSLEAMALRRRRFRENSRLDAIRWPPISVRPNLVFVQCTDKYKEPIFDDTRTYDIMLNYYDDNSASVNLADYICKQMGTKMSAISNIINMKDNVFLRYERVLFLDDDVNINTDTITRLFKVMEKNQIDLAQPSLSSRSSTWHKVLKQDPLSVEMRRVSSVEIMMPAVSNRLLHACGWVFGESISGWGTDILLGEQCYKTFGTYPAVVDICVAEHLREVDEEGGNYYRFLKEQGFDAAIEAFAISYKFGLDCDSEISLVA